MTKEEKWKQLFAEVEKCFHGGNYTPTEITDWIFGLLYKTQHEVRFCAECSKSFDAYSYQAKFCSKRCRGTHNMRRWRHKKKAHAS